MALELQSDMCYSPMRSMQGLFYICQKPSSVCIGLNGALSPFHRVHERCSLILYRYDVTDP